MFASQVFTFASFSASDAQIGKTKVFLKVCLLASGILVISHARAVQCMFAILWNAWSECSVLAVVFLNGKMYFDTGLNGKKTSAFSVWVLLQPPPHAHASPAQDPAYKQLEKLRNQKLDSLALAVQRFVLVKASYTRTHCRRCVGLLVFVCSRMRDRVCVLVIGNPKRFEKIETSKITKMHNFGKATPQ